MSGEQRDPLESCICGEHFDCPDGGCTADCALSTPAERWAAATADDAGPDGTLPGDEFLAHSPSTAATRSSNPLLIGAGLIAAERRRQIEEGFTPEHDAEHNCGELLMAAACYLDAVRGMPWAGSCDDPPEKAPMGWPFEPEAFKPSILTRDLVKVGALVAAEIDRLIAAGHPHPGRSWTVTETAPHSFSPKGWRFWLCRHCYAPFSLHPRRDWVRSRPLTDNRYLSESAPHFKEGW